jgi:23S rRNA (uridine2552-2'-O)-methyltransferase
VGRRGRVVGIDLVPCAPHGDNTVVILGDACRDDDVARAKAALDGPADAVLSDMAPRTSGTQSADQARSAELVRRAVQIACRVLRPGGSFLAKAFDGPEVGEIRARLAGSFKEVRLARPAATRKGSKEIYLVALRFRAPVTAA